MDFPKEKPTKDFSGIGGSITGLLLHLNNSIFHMGKVFILGSAFFLLVDLIDTQKRGVFFWHSD